MNYDHYKIPFGTYQCRNCGLKFDFHGICDQLICPDCAFDLTPYAMLQPVRDPINTLAVQFAEQNRQDHLSLRAELDGLRHILSAILLQEGGEYVLGDRSRMMAKPDDELEFLIDTCNRRLKIRRVDKHAPRAAAIAPHDTCRSQLPDWML